MIKTIVTGWIHRRWMANKYLSKLLQKGKVELVEEVGDKLVVVKETLSCYRVDT